MKRALAVFLLCVAAACAPRRVVLPTGPGTPTDQFRAAFDQASANCRGVRTIRATIRLSGRAGGQKMRGTLIAGFERPDSLRLEGVAPFGPPGFILVARDASATLLLPRDGRVLTGVSAADILDALAGVRLAPDGLRAMLTGCVSPDPQPSAGRLFQNGWMAVDLGDNATAYLRQEQGQWRVVAGVVPGFESRYGEFDNGRALEVQIQSRAAQPSAVPVDLVLALSDVATNVTLPAAAFQVDVPRGATPMTLAELREVGPLGQK